MKYSVFISMLCSIFFQVLLDFVALSWVPRTCALVGSCILDANNSCISHWLCVGNAIDFCIALNFIACLNGHLLVKCSLYSFFNDYSCLTKICLTVYIVFITLIALYLLIYVPCIQLVISLMKVLFVCECFKLRVYTCKCFTASRLGVSEFYHCSQTHI